MKNAVITIALLLFGMFIIGATSIPAIFGLLWIVGVILIAVFVLPKASKKNSSGQNPKK